MTGGPEERGPAFCVVVVGGVVFFRAERVEMALTGFVRSAEFRSLVPDPRDPAAATALVGRWYAEILGRAGDLE